MEDTPLSLELKKMGIVCFGTEPLSLLPTSVKETEMNLHLSNPHPLPDV